MTTESDSTMSGDLWGICAYYNPLGFQRRLANYRVFRDRLSVPLITVEYGRPGCFELELHDADIVIQCTGEDILWQRERLMNVAIQALPSSCEWVARLDGDVVFADPDWHVKAREALSGCPMVQLFDQAYDFPPEAITSPMSYFDRTECWDGFAVTWNREADPGLLDRRIQPRGQRSTVAMSLAWAFHRELHDRVPLYDCCVLGGAEHALLCAAFGLQDIVIDYQCMGTEWAKHYSAWAADFHQLLKGQIGFIKGKVGHLWHGQVSNRGYGTRYHRFESFGFDPAADLSLNASGVWQWSSDKTAMHDYVRDYFVARQEDG